MVTALEYLVEVHNFDHVCKGLFPPGIETGAFRVLGGCDNHYTTETPAPV